MTVFYVVLVRINWSSNCFINPHQKHQRAGIILIIITSDIITSSGQWNLDPSPWLYSEIPSKWLLTENTDRLHCWNAH